MTTNHAHRIGRFTMLGISDDIDHCDCCGRTGLKRTVALHPTSDASDIRYYGTSCAAAALRTSAGRVTKVAQAAQAAADAAAEQRARFAATLERIDAALAEADTDLQPAARALMTLIRAGTRGDALAAAAAHTARTLPATPFNTDTRHGLLQARDWYARHAA